MPKRCTLSRQGTHVQTLFTGRAVGDTFKKTPFTLVAEADTNANPRSPWSRQRPLLRALFTGGAAGDEYKTELTLVTAAATYTKPCLAHQTAKPYEPGRRRGHVSKTLSRLCRAHQTAKPYEPGRRRGHVSKTLSTLCRAHQIAKPERQSQRRTHDHGSGGGFLTPHRD